jgi:WD40 repeat protein
LNIIILHTTQKKKKEGFLANQKKNHPISIHAITKTQFSFMKQQEPLPKDCFKTPEGIYKVDLQIVKHAVNKGARPLYQKARTGQLLSTCIDLVDHSQQQQQQHCRNPSSSNVDGANSSIVDNASTPSSSGSMGGGGGTIGNNSGHSAKFDACGVFLTLNTQDNKIYCYNMMDMMNEKDSNEQIDRLSCDVLPTCHKMNVAELSRSKRLEILIGFSSGDVVIHNAITKNNQMFNRQLAIEKSTVKRVAWSPLNSQMFLVAHASGNMYLYDRKIQEQQAINLPPDNKQQQKQTNQNGSIKDDSYYFLQAKNHNTNPVAKYHVSNFQLNDIKFSPNGHYLAVACNDGYLKVIDFRSGKLIVTFKSYYGAFTCCCWSPDGKFIATGGEDDLVSIFDFKEKCIVARGVGHTSFVAAVIFDPIECNNEQYRILSVGDDCKLILWNIDKVSNVLNDDISPQKRSKKNNTIPSLSWNDVPTFEPVRIHRAHQEPIRDITVFDLGIVTVCNRNIIKFWLRPKAIVEDAQFLEMDDHEHMDETENSPPSISGLQDAQSI